MDTGLASQYAVYAAALAPLLAGALYASVLKRESKNRLIGVNFSKNRLFIFSGLLLVLLLLAVCRPYAGKSSIQLAANSMDVIALVDLSPSMAARDVPPSRLGFVRHKLLDLIALMQNADRKSRLAAITFSDRATLAAPMTGDFSVLPQFLNSISPEPGGQVASSLSAGLEVVSDLVRKGVTRTPLVLLFSDGNFEEQDLSAATELLATSRLKLGVIIIGTSEGAPVQLEKGRFLKDRQGNIILSRRNESFLKRLAGQSGGKIMEATLNDRDLRALLSISNSGSSQTEENVEVLGDLGPYLLVTALLVTIGAVITGNHRSIFPVLLLLVLHAFPARAQDNSPWQGHKYYESGDYNAASRVFEENLKVSPENPDLLQALAAASYKKGDFAVAEKHFRDLSRLSSRPKQKYEAFFNLGNSQVMQGEFEGAIDSYKQALSVKPDDEPASANMEYAKKLLQAKPTPTPTPDPRKSSSSSQSSSSAESQENKSEDSDQRRDVNADQGKKEEGHSGQGSSSSEINPGEKQAAGTEASSSSSAEGFSSSSPSSRSLDEPHNPEKENHSGKEAPKWEPTPSDQAPDFAKDIKRKYDSEALKREEAEAWLRSLPDSPRLLYRPAH